MLLLAKPAAKFKALSADPNQFKISSQEMFVLLMFVTFAVHDLLVGNVCGV